MAIQEQVNDPKRRPKGYGMTVIIESYQIALFAFGVILFLFSVWNKYRHQALQAREDRDAIAAELEKATFDQVEAMRTLSAFRRQYHDGTGMLTNEVQKLRREISRLKRPIAKKRPGKEG